MSDRRHILTRGRGLVFLLAAALVAAFLTGWLRQNVVAPVGVGLLQSLPWIWLRRVAFGVLIDVPQGLAVVLVGALGGRVLVVAPWRAAPALVAASWALDLVSAWLVLHELRPWTDVLCIAGRLAIAGATMLALARLLGWKPGKRRGGSVGRE
jgi:hypothetical protein